MKGVKADVVVSAETVVVVAVVAEVSTSDVRESVEEAREDKDGDRRTEHGESGSGEEGASHGLAA